MLKTANGDPAGQAVVTTQLVNQQGQNGKPVSIR